MKSRVMAAAVVAAGLSLGAAACGSGGTSPSGSASASSAASPSASRSSSAAAPTAAAPFGTGCASVPKSGAGSFSGMTAATVATAASANPLRSTLVTAVKKADLVTALNTAPALTVFAPDNAAFAKVPATTLSKVLADKTELTKVLTYHVVKGRVSPAELASGKTLTTLEGGTLKTARMGSTYEVNSADVVCGNVQTANTTVYIINGVLMPSS